MEVGEERLVPRCAGVETEGSKILNRRIGQEGGRGQICVGAVRSPRSRGGAAMTASGAGSVICDPTAWNSEWLDASICLVPRVVGAWWVPPVSDANGRRRNFSSF